MQKIAEVLYFGNNSDNYYFIYQDLELKKDDLVVVEGVEDNDYNIAIVKDIKNMDEINIKNPLKKVIRRANKKDMHYYKEIVKNNGILTKQVQELADNKDLKMSIISVAKSLDGKRTIINYKSDKRIDFREFLKEDLCPLFKNRIELRQIYVKSDNSNQQKYDIGKCGRECCCSIKGFKIPKVKYSMLTLQGFPSPEPVTGCCGRYMCCLTYENEHYKKMKETLPKKGSKVYYKDQEAVVISTNLLLEKVRIKMINEDQDDIVIVDCNYSDIIKKCTCGKKEGACDCASGNPCCKKNKNQD